MKKLQQLHRSYKSMETTWVNRVAWIKPIIQVLLQLEKIASISLNIIIQ